jgi:hypothetical protein
MFEYVFKIFTPRQLISLASKLRLFACYEVSSICFVIYIIKLYEILIIKNQRNFFSPFLNNKRYLNDNFVATSEL